MLGLPPSGPVPFTGQGRVEECAKFMHITPERVLQLAKLRVLRSGYAWGDVLVQPACVAGLDRVGRPRCAGASAARWRAGQG